MSSSSFNCGLAAVGVTVLAVGVVAGCGCGGLSVGNCGVGVGRSVGCSCASAFAFVDSSTGAADVLHLARIFADLIEMLSYRPVLKRHQDACPWMHK